MKKNIDRNTKIIIYGAAGNGMRGYNSLVTINSYNVVGFIDKRASEISTQYGLPVWQLTDTIPVDKKDCVICVCIKNVFEHSRIVNELIKIGFEYFIFKPIGISITKDLETIDENYGKIFSDVNPDSVYDINPIPQINKELRLFEYYDRAILCSDDEKITANIPFESIFTEAPDWKNGMKDSNGVVCSLSLFPQINLFNVFSGLDGDISIYLDHCASTIENSERRFGSGGGAIKDTESWRKSIIENRTDVYEKMNASLELDYSFFVENAPDCFIDDKGRLLIKSAKHRIAFFVAKKRKYIPVKMTIKDYQQYLNSSVVSILQDYLDNNSDVKLKTPIQHPFFYGIPCEWPNYYEQFLYPAITEISSIIKGKFKIENMSVLDCLDDCGSAARYASRIGFMSFASTDEKEIALSKIIDNIFYTKVNTNPNNSCDIVFLQSLDICNKNIGDKTKIVILLHEGKSPVIDKFVIVKQFMSTIISGKIVNASILIREELYKC